MQQRTCLETFDPATLVFALRSYCKVGSDWAVNSTQVGIFIAISRSTRSIILRTAEGEDRRKKGAKKDRRARPTTKRGTKFRLYSIPTANRRPPRRLNRRDESFLSDAVRIANEPVSARSPTSQLRVEAMDAWLRRIPAEHEAAASSAAVWRELKRLFDVHQISDCISERRCRGVQHLTSGGWTRLQGLYHRSTSLPLISTESAIHRLGTF